MKQASVFFKNILLVIIVSLASSSLKAQQYYNVLEYGATRDGSTKITEAIAKAIKAATAAGGGTVYFPAGEYLTGPIHFENNITIFLDAGAYVKFSNDFEDYLPFVRSRYEGVDVQSFSPLFYAYEKENIAIKGRGTIDGNGKKWWAFAEIDSRKSRDSRWQKMFFEQNKDILMPEQAGSIERGFLRPPFIQPMFCKNVLIEGITIINSPFWTVNPEFCENVTITGVTINNPPSPNTDGINPSSCKNVHISNCHISVGDDCITIKSGKDEAGRKMATPAENYTITNCTMLRGHGGVVIGSEMSGDVKRITISNCVFDGTDRGIRLKTMRGRGGVVEDIRVSNIVMRDIKDQAIVMNMHYGNTDPEPVSERTPQFKNIHFSNITAKEVNKAGALSGIEEMPIENISFTDVNIEAKDGFTIKTAKNIRFHNVQISTEMGSSIEAEEVKYLEIDGVTTLTPHANTPVIELKNVEDAFIHSAFPFSGTDVYLKVIGEKSKLITIQGNNFRHVKNPVVKGKEVQEKLTVKK